MIDSYFRTSYQKLLINPLLKNRWVSELSPIKITLLGGVAGLGVPFALWKGFPFLALGFLTMSGFFDTLDGSLARYQKKTTPKGAVLDISMDRLVEFGIVFGLYLIQPEERALPSLLMLGAIFLCVTTFLVVGIFEVNQSEKGFHYSPGIIERGEAFLFFALMILFPFYFPYLAVIFIILTLITAVIRIVQFIRH